MTKSDMGHNVSQLSLAEAKAEAQGQEDHLLGRLPVGLIESSNRIDPGTLLSCRDDAYQWSGGVTVSLTEGAKAAELLGDVAAGLDRDESSEGLTLQTRRSRPDSADFVLRGAHGASYYMSARQDGTGVVITSFSPCVELQTLPPTGLSY